MNLPRVWAFAQYEIRRATARKKVLALVVITILIDTIPYYLLRSIGTGIFPPQAYPYLWVFGIFVPQGFFLPFTALLIAAGSMSEEYEQGTAEVLLSKPVTRDEFFAGKFLGGYLLLAMVILLNAILTIASATFTFGIQLALGVLPAVVLAQIFSGVLFYSIAFMSGELVRRSSLSYITASASYFISEIAGIYLRLIYSITGNPFYQQINSYLPTTPVSSLPLLLGQPGLPKAAQAALQFVGTPTETSALFSIGIIAAYALVAILIARTYFNRVDIAKRVA